MKKHTAKKKIQLHPLIVIVVVLVVAASFLTLEAIYRLRGSSLMEKMLGKPKTRMSSYEGLPSTIYHDLQYLTYIDSLAREDRALPDNGNSEGKNIARLIFGKTGVPITVLNEWGITDSAGLNDFFRDMYERDRLLLPRENVSLYKDIKDKRIFPGMILFGQTLPYKEDEGVDFCAVFSSVNWFQPDFSTIIYFLPDSESASGRARKIIHGSLKEMPDIAYFGCGIPGYNMDKVYTRYIRLARQKSRKPLYR